VFQVAVAMIIHSESARREVPYQLFENLTVREMGFLNKKYLCGASVDQERKKFQGKLDRKNINEQNPVERTTGADRSASQTARRTTNIPTVAE
jgi:hypothetical protein